MSHKKCQPSGQPSIRCFSGPIADAKRPNPLAHGNITRTETCSCGATRQVNVNGTHKEIGSWIGGAR